MEVFANSLVIIALNDVPIARVGLKISSGCVFVQSSPVVHIHDNHSYFGKSTVLPQDLYNYLLSLIQDRVFRLSILEHQYEMIKAHYNIKVFNRLSSPFPSSSFIQPGSCLAVPWGISAYILSSKENQNFCYQSLSNMPIEYQKVISNYQNFSKTFNKAITLIRLTDLILVFITLPFTIVLFALILILSFFYCSSPIFSQLRVGKNKKVFRIYKFRTLPVNVNPNLPTHTLHDVKLSAFYSFLRLSRLDELPQLLNIIRGELSLVGPRPCLTTQYSIIDLREKNKIFKVLPGITGYAQICSVDMSDPDNLIKHDMPVKNLSMKFYFEMLISTFSISKRKVSKAL